MSPKPDPQGPKKAQSLLNKRKPVPTPRSTLKKGSSAKKPENLDILTALEGISGVGSLRSLNVSSSFEADKSNQSHTLNPKSWKEAGMERDESSHSLTFTPKGVNTSSWSPPILEKSLQGPGSGSTGLETGSEDTKSSSLINMEPRKSVIQERPLPDLPEMKDQNTQEEEAVYSSLLTPLSETYQELKPKVMDHLLMPGTIRRGKFKEKAVDVTLTLTEHDLSRIEKRLNDKSNDRIFCGLRRGPHVFVLSLLSSPFLWIYSTIYSFFLGSMTWYNIFIHYNEERSCCHTLLSPFVLLLYPFWIAPVTVFLGIYRGVSQISWYWDSWAEAVANPDCGFMGWVCGQINLPDCSPYQVVLLGDTEKKPTMI